MTPEIRGHHITTRTGGTLDSRPRREPHAPHQGSSLQGLEMTGSGADHGNRSLSTKISLFVSSRPPKGDKIPQITEHCADFRPVLL